MVANSDMHVIYSFENKISCLIWPRNSMVETFCRLVLPKKVSGALQCSKSIQLRRNVTYRIKQISL